MDFFSALLKFGVYFSLIDWNFPGALPFTSTRNSDSIPPAHHQFNLHQISELMTNYGEISEIWFDMGSPTYQQSKEIRDLIKKLQPNCMINGRLWNNQGDFAVMGDNQLPDSKMGVPWQTPASMFDETWGYRSWQERGDVNDKIAEKLKQLIKIVSQGGNYLLNIGPMGNGAIVPFEKEVLLGMGKWIKENAESIYETRASNLQKQDWGYVTEKPGKIYLQIVDYPQNNQLLLKGIKVEITKVYLLTDKMVSLTYKLNKNEVFFDLPANINSKFPRVIVIEYQEEPEFTDSKILSFSSKGKYILTDKNAEKYFFYTGHDYYSNKSAVLKMVWKFPKVMAGKYKITIHIKAKDIDNDLKLNINDKEFIINAVTLINQEIDGIELNTNKLNTIQLCNKRENLPSELKTESLELVIEKE